MIALSNGYRFTFCCGSGALGFSGLGWPWEAPLRWLGLLNPHALTVVAKTVTAEPIRGNLSPWHPWTCVRLIPGGATNAVGLTNPGIDRWFQRDYLRARRNHIDLAVSVKAESSDEARELVALLWGCEVPFIEVNASCPNVKKQEDVAKIVGVLSELKSAAWPLILKLSLDQIDPDFIRAVEGNVEALHAINTIPWAKIYPQKPSPIQRYRHGQQGGVSGEPIKSLAIDAVCRLRDMTSLPIVGGGGISSLDDVLAFEEAGASAFSIGTLFLRCPWLPNQIINQYRDQHDILERIR